MKAFILVVMASVICAAVAAPTKEGLVFSKEAIGQAMDTALIPKDALIQNVQESRQVAAYESIPGNQDIDLRNILSQYVPAEVISNLQGQINQIGLI